VRSVKKFLGIILVGLLTVIPLGFPSASSVVSMQWDDSGKLILPDGYRMMSDTEYMAWYCQEYPDDCEMRMQAARTQADINPGDGGGGS
jgi:hypothetical protein